MPSVHAEVDSPWSDGSTLHSTAVDLPWKDGTTVHAGPSTYTPGDPPEGSTPTTPVAPTMLRIGARPTYNVVHEVTAIDLRDDSVLDVFDLSIAIDEDSVFWTLRASGPGSLFAKLTTGEQPAQIEVTIDGIAWRFAVDSVSRSREFGVSTATFTARSLSVVAAAPYQIESNWVNDGVTTAAQMAAVANIYTGLEVIWRLEDWIIPDKIFSFSGTPLGVVRRIAEAVGATVTSDRVGASVTVAPRYPLMPNAWPVSPVNVQIAFEAVQSETFERADRPEYDGVYVSGQQGGVVGFVRLEGTGGAVLHPLVTELLLTEAPALRQRGTAILGASGGQARVTQVLPVLTGEGEPGVLEIGQLVRVLDPAGTWYGLVRAVSVSASGVQRDPRVRQTVTFEVHTRPVAGTVLEVPDEPEPLFTLRTAVEDMLHAAVYQAAHAGSVPLGGTFDTSKVGEGVVFPTLVTADCSVVDRAIIGTVDKDSADAGPFFAEVTIGGSGDLSVYVGAFVQAFGPPFNPDLEFGGPLGTFYRSDGVKQYYGGTGGDLPTFGPGDTIGVVIDPYSSQVAFYRNGVAVTTAGLSNNQDVFLMCGTWSP